MRPPELTIYHQAQELQAKKAELLTAHSGGSAHKEKSGWGSKLGALALVRRVRGLRMSSRARCAGRFFLGSQHDNDSSAPVAPPMEGLGPI